MAIYSLEDNKVGIAIAEAGGSSATNVVSRFSHLHEQVRQYVREITEQEKKRESDTVVRAEIVYAADPKIGNIMRRTSFREYEISLFANPGLPVDQQIALNDIYVSVVDNKVILRSGKLNKQILPMNSTAHNFSNPQSLPAYRFLSSVQVDTFCTSFSFNWGSLSMMFHHLPRVVYDGCILSAATWLVSTAGLRPLQDEPDDKKLIEKAAAWRHSLKLPQYVLLSDSDNQLLTDLENPISLRILLNTARHRSAITLKEYLGTFSNGVTVDQNGDSYHNEFLFGFASKKISPATFTPATQVRYDLQRNSGPGSEWLYLKIYTGIKISDRLLSTIIAPACRQFIASAKIKEWFFIRYRDPEQHIRLRFKLTERKYISDILVYFNDILAPFIADGLVKKVQTDTYERELERYGQERMSDTEQIFYRDSEMVCQLISLEASAQNTEIRWLSALKAIDSFLGHMGYGLGEKEQILSKMAYNFSMEHGRNKILTQKLAAKYRAVKNSVDEFMRTPER